MGTGAQILQLLAGEDVNGDQVDFGMTVLSGLGGAHFDNLAGATLDDHMPVLAKGGTLHGEGRRGASIDGLKGVFMLLSWFQQLTEDKTGASHSRARLKRGWM